MKTDNIVKETTDKINEIVVKRLQWEKKNLRRSRHQFCRDCGISFTTMYNFINKSKGNHLDTAIRMLAESGYKIEIVPI